MVTGFGLILMVTGSVSRKVRPRVLPRVNSLPRVSIMTAEPPRGHHQMS
jgi:hypothetical protein